MKALVVGFFVITLISFNSLFAQETFKILPEKHEETYRVEVGDFGSFFGSHDDTLFFTRHMYKLEFGAKWGYRFSSIDMINKKTGALIKKLELKPGKKNVDYYLNATILKGSSLLAVYNVIDQNNKQQRVEMLEYDFNGNVIGQPVSTTIYPYTERPLYNTFIKDVSKENIAVILVPYDHKKEIIYSVLDHKFKEIQSVKAKTDKPVIGVRYNEEYMYLLTRDAKADQVSSVTHLKLTKVALDGSLKKTISLPDFKGYITNIWFAETADSQFDIKGYYMDGGKRNDPKKAEYINGCYNIRIDMKSMSVTSEDRSEFDADFVNAFSSGSVKKGIKDVRNLKVAYMKDGSSFLFSENHYVKGGIISPSKIHNKDIMITAFNAEGKIQWTKSIRKYQKSFAEDEKWTSYGIFKSDQKVGVVFNDRWRNIGDPSKIKKVMGLNYERPMVVYVSSNNITARRVIGDKPNVFQMRPTEIIRVGEYQYLAPFQTLKFAGFKMLEWYGLIDVL